MGRIRGALVSLRTTAALLVALSILLVLNVTLPQQAVDPPSYAAAVRDSRLGKVVLETFGLGHVATSAAFLTVVALFFANLAAVLVVRFRATLKRSRFEPPAEAQVRALLAAPGAIETAYGGTDPAPAAEILTRLGYRVAPAGRGAVWGVKHRLAPLGFPVFHASFFFMCAGGLALYLTRDVVTLTVTEGLEAQSSAGSVVRRSPLGAPRPVGIGLERVDVELERGVPVDLSATVSLDGVSGRLARINAPLRLDSSTILVERAGVAPVLWLVDERGFTLDRVLVAVATPPGFPTRLELTPGDIDVAIEPIPVGPSFPERSDLGRVPLTMRLRHGGQTVFDGVARPGDVIAVGSRALRISEVRYWAGFRIVSERGGALLVAGFVLAVAGIVLRMVLFRREMVVALGDGKLRMAGRAEFIPARAREEMMLAQDLILAREDSQAAARSA